MSSRQILGCVLTASSLGLTSAAIWPVVGDHRRSGRTTYVARDLALRPSLAGLSSLTIHNRIPGPIHRPGDNPRRPATTPNGSRLLRRRDAGRGSPLAV